MANQLWVTTTFGFEGYKITRYLGVVRGITVRSRSVVGNFVGSLQTLVGGNITVYTELCEHARLEALRINDAACSANGSQCSCGDAL